MSETIPSDGPYAVLIVGGGSAGITVAAMLRGKVKGRIGLIEPSDTHAYQPGWTFVGSGVFRLQDTVRREAGLIPKGVDWIRSAVGSFTPDNNVVELQDGRALSYRFLIVCPGLKLDWNAVHGLADAVGGGGVCSNYRGEHAAHTWECIRNFRGGKMIFTQPPMPIKCPGAPQKIAYLAADHLRRSGRCGRRASADIAFCTALPTLFGVAPFVPPLKAAMRRHGIEVNYKTNLKEIDARAKKAVFQVTQEDGSMAEMVRDYDMIHVTPPQTALDFMKSSPIVDTSGFVDIDQYTMRHKIHGNIFSLGDAANSPNSKTVAAIRMQAPIVVRNLLAAMRAQPVQAKYDGYGSCPLTTDYGKIVLAEFAYGGKVTPSFPLDPRVPRYAAWLLKKDFLPFLYWNIMLKGINLDIGHRERNLHEEAA